MTQNPKTLDVLWETQRHLCGWLSMLCEALDLDAEDEAYLSGLEDSQADLRHDIEEGPLEWKPREMEWVRDERHSLKTLWMVDVRARFSDFVAEVRRDEPEWVRERRGEWLKTEIQNLDQKIKAAYQEYASLAAQDRPERTLFLVCSGVHDAEKQRTRLNWESRSLLGHGKCKTLEPSQIERARSRDLAELVEVGRGGYILCPLHKDRNPSMLVRNGFGYCFGCSGHLDSIGYMMQTRGMTFRQAVEALQ